MVRPGGLVAAYMWDALGGACFLVMLATGALLLVTTQFLPELVQEDFGYNATLAGVMVSPGGVVAIADPTTVITRGSTYDNRANLAPAFLQQIVRKYEGTRLVSRRKRENS